MERLFEWSSLAVMPFWALLAFDLFVGRWAYLDGRERGVSPWLMAPVLLLTLMFGPLGLLAHLALRALPPRAPVVAEVRS